jgi:Phosphotransferase enzyme family
MSTSPHCDFDPFRILVYRNDATELLAETTSAGFRLPAVAIPRYTRVAAQLTDAVKKFWDIETCCLFTLPSSTSSYAVLESYCSDTEHRTGISWVPLDSLPSRPFEDPADLAAVHTSQETLNQYRRGELPGVFGRPGWLRMVLEWAEGQAAAAGLRLTGAFRHLNASPTFSLIRFETDGPAVWFKAVGEPNLREYPITAELTQFFPAYVPKIIGKIADWNAWLAVEVEGIHLDESSDFGIWMTVATTLADLQIASRGQSLHLIHTGCQDARVCSLAEVVNPFLEVMAELMDRQTKDSPPRLSRKKLAVLGSQLQDALSSLSCAKIPNVLGHLDFNPGNILVSRNRCVFLDWAEACVGHPFLTFQLLVERWRRLFPLRESLENKLLSAYLERWQPLTEPGQLTEAHAIAPLLAVFSYAAVGQPWRDARWRDHLDTAGYLRSLTRRMQREADRWVASKSHRTVIRCNSSPSEVIRCGS